MPTETAPLSAEAKLKAFKQASNAVELRELLGTTGEQTLRYARIINHPDQFQIAMYDETTAQQLADSMGLQLTKIAALAPLDTQLISTSTSVNVRSGKIESRGPHYTGSARPTPECFMLGFSKSTSRVTPGLIQTTFPSAGIVKVEHNASDRDAQITDGFCCARGIAGGGR